MDVPLQLCLDPHDNRERPRRAGAGGPANQWNGGVDSFAIQRLERSTTRQLL